MAQMMGGGGLTSDQAKKVTKKWQGNDSSWMKDLASQGAKNRNNKTSLGTALGQGIGGFGQNLATNPAMPGFWANSSGAKGKVVNADEVNAAAAIPGMNQINQGNIDGASKGKFAMPTSEMLAFGAMGPEFAGMLRQSPELAGRLQGLDQRINPNQSMEMFNQANNAFNNSYNQMQGNPMLQYLQNVATGDQMGAAQRAGLAQQQQIANNAMAMAGAGGMNDAANMRAALNAATNAGVQTAGNTAAAAAQESLGAAGQVQDVRNLGAQMRQQQQMMNLAASGQDFGQGMGELEFLEKVRGQDFAQNMGLLDAYMQPYNTTAAYAGQTAGTEAAKAGQDKGFLSDMMGGISGALGGIFSSIPFF